MPNRLNGQMNKAIEEQSKFNIKIRQSVEKEIFVWFIYVRSAISDDNCIVLYCMRSSSIRPPNKKKKIPQRYKPSLYIYFFFCS